MNTFVSFRATKYFLSCLSVFCVLLFSQSAFAQIEGCKPEIMQAMDAKATAKTAYDVAAAEQVIVKPDSVLAMTCYNKSAGVSAEVGGNLFSGSFLGNGSFISLIGDMLAAFFGQFADAEGFDNTGVVDYAATAPANDTTCPDIQRFWTRIKEKGVSGGVPFATFDDLINGILPGGAGTRFQQNWNTANADGVFSSLQTAMTALPLPAVPSFATCTTLAGVIAAAAGTPCP